MLVANKNTQWGVVKGLDSYLSCTIFVFRVKSDATVMLHTVLQLAICANLSWAPASPDCLILRIHIPLLLMAAWTLSPAQLISAKPNKHKTTLAPPPCPHWNAVMKICAITEDYMMFCLLPGAIVQVGQGSVGEFSLLAIRLVTVKTLYALLLI